MAKVKIQGHASGTGILTVTAPNTSTDRTITLPDSTATIATTTEVALKAPIASPEFTGNVGIGGSPSRNLSVNSGGSSGYIQLCNTASGTAASDGLEIKLDSAGANADIRNRENGYLSFYTNNSERMRILSSGGITFNGDTAAANALDDYETGTFTATLTGHTSNPSTPVTETAYYTKIGNVVQIAIAFNNRNTSGAVGNVRVTGLPFTSKSGEPRYPLSAVFYHRFTWDTDRTAYMLIPDDRTYMYAYALKGGTTWEQVTHSAGTGMHLWISGTYLT
jgi:hypothetical protein